METKILEFAALHALVNQQATHLLWNTVSKSNAGNESCSKIPSFNLCSPQACTFVTHAYVTGIEENSYTPEKHTHNHTHKINKVENI